MPHSITREYAAGLNLTYQPRDMLDHSDRGELRLANGHDGQGNFVAWTHCLIDHRHGAIV